MQIGLRFTGLFLIGLILSACSSTGALKVDEKIVPYMVSLNANGETFEIEYVKNECRKINGSHCNKEELIDFHIGLIFCELVKVGAQKNNIEILLFIHGGLVSKNRAAIDSKKIIDEINLENRKFPKKPYIYPLLINWESSMFASYKNHLVKIRQGKRLGGKVASVLGWGTSPFYLLGDTGRAITRLPITYGYQAYHIVKPVKERTDNEISSYNTHFYPSEYHVGHGISLGKENINIWAELKEKSTYIFPGFLKLISTPVLDIVGKSSWDNMLRRTRTVFRSSWDFDCSNARDCMRREPNGGVSKLMRMFRKLKNVNPNPNRYSVTLIGHSMGTFVASEILRKYSGHQDFSYNDIIYMAAASSFNDFETSVVPYLESHRETNFYNLTLHPYAEENENFWFDIAPRGSLLVWLDDFATIPSTQADRTLGRWDNAIGSWSYIPKIVRNKTTLKGFGVVEDSKSNTTDPQEHGQFNDVKFRFWHRSFWEVN